MPKRSKMRQQLLGSLIETKPTSWDRKVLSKNAEGKEVVQTVKVTHTALRYPLAQNVSELNVNRAAKVLAK